MGYRSASLGTSNKEPFCPWRLVSHTHTHTQRHTSPQPVWAGKLSHPTAKCISRPHPTRKAGGNTWTLCSLATLEQADLMVCRAKAVAQFCQVTWGSGQLESGPQRTLQALGLVTPLCSGRGTDSWPQPTDEYGSWFCPTCPTKRP